MSKGLPQQQASSNPNQLLRHLHNQQQQQQQHHHRHQPQQQPLLSQQHQPWAQHRRSLELERSPSQQQQQNWPPTGQPQSFLDQRGPATHFTKQLQPVVASDKEDQANTITTTSSAGANRAGNPSLILLGQRRSLPSPSDASLRMRAPSLHRPDIGPAIASAPPSALPISGGPNAAPNSVGVVHSKLPPAAAVGGQRMALKLASQKPAAAQQQAGIVVHTNHSQQQRWPAQGAGAHIPGAGSAPGICCQQQEHESDCSCCSNSIDCLSSGNQPLMAGPLPPVAHHHHAQQQQLQNHHHQHQLQRHPPQHQHHHHHHHHHDIDASDDLGGGGSAGGGVDEAEDDGEDEDDDDCAFMNHHQSFHRPLMPYSSAPAPLQLGGHPGGSASSSPVQPAPLIGQNTYSATSDTITDASMFGGHPHPHHHHHHQQHQPQHHHQHQHPIPLTPPPPPMARAPGSSDFIPANSDHRGPTVAASANRNHHTQQQQHHQYNTMSRLEVEQMKQQHHHHNGHRRQTVSFRSRPAAVVTGSPEEQPSTASGGKASFNGEGQQTIGGELLVEADSHSNNNKLPADTTRHKPLGRQRSSTAAAGASQQQQQAPNSVSDSGRPSNSSNSGATAAQDLTSGAGAGQFNLSGGAGQLPHHHLPPHHHHHGHLGQLTPGLAGGYTPVSPLPPGSLRASHLRGAAAFAEGACPMPAITSHRTNSPWMRISSIILTPIGIVIILFIVVSPLLHYLM